MHHRRGPVVTGVNERGAALILALAFLTVMGVLAVSLASMAMSGSSTLEVYRENRAIRTNAESAINLTIFRLVKNPLMATDATSTGTPPLDAACNLAFPIATQHSGDAPIAPSFTAGSTLTVTCGPTTPASATGPWGAYSGSGGLDTDGGQRPRDVTINVACLGTAVVKANSTITCGSTGTSRLVARARVRFEIDTTATNRSQRAVIPKVMTWDLHW